MKNPLSKAYIKYPLIIGLLLLLFLPVYMYFSHDVTLLRTHYPFVAHEDEDGIVFDISDNKPESWVTLDKISPYAKWAIIFSEDWSFYQHKGVDFEQMKVALRDMLEATRFRGASTITQQMVKNVYLLEETTYFRKFHEIVLAQKVERALTKDRILEIYLNCIEYGPSIYGIKEAASHYFKKRPSKLTPREGAFLALLLPSPKRYSVSFRKKRLTKFATSRLNTILKKMRMGKAITAEQYESEIQQKFSWEEE